MYSRWRFTFEKKGAVCFVSHLDMLKIFQKAIKRANLPVAFSKGFNPHQLVGFALPLPIGTEAEAEIAEIEFEEYLPGEELISALNSQLPEGLRAFSAVMLSNDSKSAASLVYGSVNQAVFPYDEGLNAGLDKVIAEILSQDTILADKRSKAGTKKIDIRPLIFDIVNTSQGGAVSIRFATAAGSEKSLRPEMVCAEIYKRLGLDYSFASVRYTRKGLLIHEQ